jgi:hypothetical protein
MEKFINKLLVVLYDANIFVRYKGLRPLTEKRKKNDLELGSLFKNFWGYSPLAEEKIISTLSNKDQKKLSNCSFQAATVQKEIDEGVILSARDLTTSAYRKSLCSWEGYADLKAAQEILKKIGIDEEKFIREDTDLSFGNYIDIAQNPNRQSDHKTKTYWRVNNTDEGLKAIDEGHAIVIGVDWYSGFNQSGGFSLPWLIWKIIGYFVGGHAMLWKGYIMNYLGRKVAVVQNSYSKLWGDKGDLYIDLEFLDKYIKKYGAYCNLDIEYDKVLSANDVIEKYEGKNVRGNKSVAIFKIYDGQKFTYRDDYAFVAENGYPYAVNGIPVKGAFTVVPQESVDQIPFYGGSMTTSMIDGSSGKFIDMAEKLKKPINDNFQPNIEV